MEVFIICIEQETGPNLPTCVYRDKCSHYGVLEESIDDDDDSEHDDNDLETGSLALTPDAQGQLDRLNGTDFYRYGARQAHKDTKRRRR